MHGVGVKGAPRRHHVHLCSFLNTWKCLMRIYPISFDGIDWYMLIRCLHSIFFSGFLRGKNIERNILMIILVRSQIQPKFPRHGQNLFNSLTVEPNMQAQIYTLSKTGLYMIFRLFVLERCLFVWKKKNKTFSWYVSSQREPTFPRHGQKIVLLTVRSNQICKAQIYKLSRMVFYKIFRLFILERN